MSKFDELAGAAKKKLDELEASERKTDEEKRKLQRAQNTKDLQDIFERHVSKEAREELHPTYACDDLGKGTIRLIVNETQFEIEIDTRYYRDSTNSIFVTTAGKEQRHIGNAYFRESAKFEARLLTRIKNYLDNPSGPHY